MGKFVLRIKANSKVYERGAINSHQLPRVGEQIDMGTLYDDYSEDPALEVMVTSVVHPISTTGSIPLPIVTCGHSQTGLSSKLATLINGDARWNVSESKIPEFKFEGARDTEA